MEPLSKNSNNLDHRTRYPKSVQYANEILEGKYTLESLKGQISGAWIDAVKKELESRGYLVIKDSPAMASESIEQPNLSVEEIKNQIETTKKDFLQETDNIVEHSSNIGIELPESVVQEIKKEIKFDEHLDDLKNEIEESFRDIDKIENVNQKIKEYLLSKVDITYTIQLAKDVQTNNINQFSGKEFYALALNEYYKYLRSADYPRDPRFDFDIDTITIEPNQLIKRVQANNDGWHYRMAQTSTSANKAYARISLNVVGSKKLVESLDKIAYRYGIYYKTPDHSDRWDERTDPVTIYINNPNLTPELIEQLKQEVTQESKSFIRDNQGFGVYGDNISTGVEFGLENSVEDIKIVKQKAKEISDELYEAVSDFLMKGGKEKGSVGQIMTVKKLIKMFQDDKK